MIIQLQNKLYTFHKDDYEPEDMFYNRIWFIASQEPNNQADINKYIDYSYIWINITYNHVTYDKMIMNNVSKYSKNLNKQYLFNV